MVEGGLPGVDTGNKAPAPPALVVRHLTPNAGHIRDEGSISGLERFSGGGHGNPL